MPKSSANRHRRRQRGQQGKTIPKLYSEVCETPKASKIELKSDAVKFFTVTTSFDHHYEAQNQNVTLYVSALVVLLRKGITIPPNTRVQALAAAWARRDFELASALLLNKDNFGLVEVLKAVTLLDSNRQLRVEEKKLKILTQSANKVNPQKIAKIKSQIDCLNALKPKFGSASSAVCKNVKKWTRKLTKEELEFYALNFPKKPWRMLADICHLNPKEDFPSLPWFVCYCFDAPPPEDTIVSHFVNVSAENVNELIQQHPVPFACVKQFKNQLTDQSKQLIAQCDKLDQVIWYYEDLQCSAVDEVLQKRLTDGEKVTLLTGKLIERLLTIKMIQEADHKKPKAAFIHQLIPVAEERLRNTRLTLDSPVVVMGDRSGSMQVAIRTSTIIAGLLSAACNAKLVFFAEDNTDAPFVPTTIEEVLEMALTINTGGLTAPAASLWPFYESKEVIRSIILVTDEQENTPFHNMRFAELFQKYKQEVSPDCRLVFVSFLARQHTTGQMMQKLIECGMDDGVMQFKFHPSRPDLTKLDRMLGLLSAVGSALDEEINNVETDITICGILNKIKDWSIKENW